MGYREAAYAASLLLPEALIAIHHGTFANQMLDMDRLEAEMKVRAPRVRYTASTRESFEIGDGANDRTAHLPGAVCRKETELESVFRDAFVPAISVQEGFRRVTLLKVRDAMRQYRIVLAFGSEELRLKWVASKEHQQAFPKIMALCQQITWAGFDVVQQHPGK